jgi:1-aminocyclopropane-1-carboxylate deaminase
MKTLANLAQKNQLTSAFTFPFEQVKVLDQYHSGGYAKTTPELLAFVEDFNLSSQFQIEPVYTGKALFALAEELPCLDGSCKSVLFVHTGGVVFAQ